MNSFERTLQELEKEGGLARVRTIRFLNNYKFNRLTAQQLLKILEIINQEENKNV